MGGRLTYVLPPPRVARPAARRRRRPAATASTAATAAWSSTGGRHGRVVAVASAPRGAASQPGPPSVKQLGEGAGAGALDATGRAVVSTAAATAAAAAAAASAGPAAAPASLVAAAEPPGWAASPPATPGDGSPSAASLGWADDAATADVWGAPGPPLVGWADDEPAADAAGVSRAPPPGWADEVAATDGASVPRGWADRVAGSVVDMAAWDHQRLADVAAWVRPRGLAASAPPPPAAAPLTPAEAAAAAATRRRALRRLRRAVAHEAAGGHANAVDDAGTPFAAYASRVVADLGAATGGGVRAPRLVTARLVAALDRYDDLSASARVELAARLAAYPASPPSAAAAAVADGGVATGDGSSGGGTPAASRASRHAVLLRAVRALTPPAAVSAAPNWRWLAVPRSRLRASSGFLPLPPVPLLAAGWATRWSTTAAGGGGGQGVPVTEYRRLRPDALAADAVRGVVEVAAGDAWRLLGLGGGVLGAPAVPSPSTAALLAEAAAAAAAAASVAKATAGAAPAPAPLRATPAPVPYFPLPPRRVRLGGGRGGGTPVVPPMRRPPPPATARTAAARVAAAAARERARVWADSLPAWVALTCPAVRGAASSASRRALFGPSATLRGTLAAAHAANGALCYLQLVNPGGGQPDRVRLEEVGVCVASAADVRRAAAGDADGLAVTTAADTDSSDGATAAPPTRLPTIGADIAAFIRHRDAAAHGAWAAAPTRILLVDVVSPFVEAPPPAGAPPTSGPYYRLAPSPPPSTLPAASYATAQLSLLAAGPAFSSAIVLLTAPTVGATLFTVRRDAAFLATTVRALGGLAAAHGAAPPPPDYWTTNADCRAAAAAAAAGVAATGTGRAVCGADAEGGLPITDGVGTPWNGGNREDGPEPGRWARLSPFLDYVGGAGGGGEEEGAMLAL